MPDSTREESKVVHTHYRPDHDHIHDHDEPVPVEQNPIWQQDNVSLTSVGIDVGSSGTQVVFSKLLLRRIGEELTSRFVVVSRETWYRSPVELTPYVQGDLIDAEALGRIVDAAYGNAGTIPANIDTGVVILTGEALRRRNAGRITRILAEQGGELVCASAGHNMEAQLAAYGSGAARRSYEAGTRILNIDIGGGTTKLGLIDRGQVVATAAVTVGGRLAAVDENEVLQRLEPTGRDHAQKAGLTWNIGDSLAPTEREHVGCHMAEVLIDLLSSPGSDGPAVLAGPLPPRDDIDGVIFSGGVAEYVYGRETRDFGDVGRALGGRLRKHIDAGTFPFPVLPPGECIRATALGASEYSIQLSGSTGYISDPDALLPMRNLQVVRPELELTGEVNVARVRSAIEERLGAFDVDFVRQNIALALNWTGLPSHERLFAFASGIKEAMRPGLEAGRPLLLVIDADVARSLGRLLRSELAIDNEILVIDGIRLWDFDFVDIGKMRFPSNTVPVTIKSLLFEAGQPVAEDS